MNCRGFTALTLGLLTLVGCGEKNVSVDNAVVEVRPTDAIKTVRLQIDGFKKSKSGAT